MISSEQMRLERVPDRRLFHDGGERQREQVDDLAVGQREGEDFVRSPLHPNGG
jgi:hypothetical protein